MEKWLPILWIIVGGVVFFFLLVLIDSLKRKPRKPRNEQNPP